MKKIIATFAVVTVSAVLAEVKVSEMFSDDMVLQRGRSILVWGRAGNIHPYNKADVGARLALWALRDV